jgi:3-deoxy-D-manno-octulosonate 8-phosphate phosphatase (KDO 8-P phosphatase)
MAPSTPALTSELTRLIRTIRLIAFDFDGVFTDNMVYVFEDGREAVRCSRADGIGLRKLDKASVQTVILSTEVNPVVTARSRKLGIRCVQGCLNKQTSLEQFMAEAKLTYAQVAFVGNDENDAGCLQQVALPIVVRDAYPSVVSLARYQTQAAGGHGAVREVCDLFEQALARPL